MHKWLAIGLLACASRAPAPLAAPSENAWPLCSIYRLNLADDPDAITTFERTTAPEHPEDWMLRPEVAVGAVWFQEMRRRGFTSFDLSALKKVPWDVIPRDTERLSLMGHPLRTDLLALKQLRWLDLSLSSATDSACEALIELTFLRRLALFKTEVGDACIAALTRMPRLERLDLGKTHVSDAGVVKLVALTQLSSLGLNGTAVSDRSITVLLNRFALQSLDVGDTMVTNPTKLARSTSLERLDLGQTAVSPGIVRALLRHPYLKWLSLSGIGIDDKGLAQLMALKRLEVLDLSSTHVGTLTALPALEGLLMLSVAHTFVADLTPLRTMLSLRYLDLSATAVQTLAPIVGLPELRSLYLAADTLGDFPLVAKMSKLMTLDVSDTSVGDDTVRVLPETLHMLHLGRTLVGVEGLKALGRLHALETLDVTAAPLDRALLAEWRMPRLKVLNASLTRLRRLRGMALPPALERLYLVGVDIPNDELPQISTLTVIGANPGAK